MHCKPRVRSFDKMDCGQNFLAQIRRQLAFILAWNWTELDKKMGLCLPIILNTHLVVLHTLFILHFSATLQFGLYYCFIKDEGNKQRGKEMKAQASSRHPYHQSSLPGLAPCPASRHPLGNFLSQHLT